MSEAAQVEAAIADPNADLPRGARRMTRVERKNHVQNVLDALQKQSKVRGALFIVLVLASLIHPQAVQPHALLPMVLTVCGHQLCTHAHPGC
jgi:hypothetical protein